MKMGMRVGGGVGVVLAAGPFCGCATDHKAENRGKSPAVYRSRTNDDMRNCWKGSLQSSETYNLGHRWWVEFGSGQPHTLLGDSADGPVMW